MMISCLPARTLRSTGISRLHLLSHSGRSAAPVLTRSTPSLTAILISPSPSATTITFTPSTIRLFSSTSLICKQKKDTTWVSKGPMEYTEVKSLSSTPDGSTVLLDVREPSETAQGMIPSAVNVPLSEFNSAFLQKEGPGDFELKYSFRRPSYDQKIIVYCRSGKRSEQARTELSNSGWWNVRNYTGSWLDWTAQEKASGNNANDDD